MKVHKVGERRWDGGLGALDVADVQRHKKTVKFKNKNKPQKKAKKK